MFNLLRRRKERCSSKEGKKRSQNVAKHHELTAGSNPNTLSQTSSSSIGDPEDDDGERDVTSDEKSKPQNRKTKFLTNSARALARKVKLDSTLPRQSKETPSNKSSFDGCVVVNENSTNSRNEGADPLGQRRIDNDTDGDQHNSQLHEKPAKRSKDKGQSSSNRRSIFFRHFQSTAPTATPSEQRYHQLNEDHPEFINESAPAVVTGTSSESSGTSIECKRPSRSLKRFNPIVRSREFFNDILMAKGRHRNHRNHHHKNAATTAKSNQDSKKDYDLPKQLNPEPSAAVQHTYQISQESINTPRLRTADGAAAAAPTNVVSAVSSVECADSIGVINNSITTQTHAVAKAERQNFVKDVTIIESSKHIQTIAERASIQVHQRESASEVARNNVAVENEQNNKIVQLESFVKDVTIIESSKHTQTITEQASIEIHQRESASEVTKNNLAVENEQNNKTVPNGLESDRVTAYSNVEDLGNLKELTECDQDRSTVETNNTNPTNIGEMGQTQAKTEPTATVPVTNSRSASPSNVREFRESHVADNQRPFSPPQISTTRPMKLIVPKIVVEDFGNPNASTTTTTTLVSSSSDKAETFNDSVNNQSVPEAKIENHLLKVPSTEDVAQNEHDDDEEYDVEEDQWHFVNNLLNLDGAAELTSEGNTATTAYQRAENSSDSNLSNSDSGIASSPAEKITVSKILHLESCDLVNDKSTSAHRIRDGNSTECDESLPLCDEFDYYKNLPTNIDNVLEVSADDNHPGILIESISLPDVVVESETAQNVLKNGNSNNINGSDSVNGGVHRTVDDDDVEHVDNSASVKMGNVHFIPIRVEKRRSIDDSVLMSKSASGGNSLYNGQQYNEEKATVVITSEEDDKIAEEQAAKAANAEEKHKKELVDQETHFNAQLDDAQKNIFDLESKVGQMQSKIDDLERELSAKTWNVERLESEIGAARKEDEFVRRKLKLLEDEKTTLRQKSSETEEDLQRKCDNLDREYKDLDERYKEMKLLAGNLQTQLACAQTEAEQCRKATEDLRHEKDEQVRLLEEALASAKEGQEAMQKKWQKEFECLRTQNASREESLMSDCEWQLRQMQKSCKEKIDKAEHQRKEAIEQNKRIEEEAEEKLHEVEHLRSYEAEVKQLRGLTSEQENSITSMRNQIEELKADLVIANENLEEQIEEVRKIKYQCNNAIYDKEREMLQKIDDVRNEAASLWENKLITEMTRLKTELESVYVDQRREELNKLQAEHIEELKALTSRYTANEEELRAEIAELKASLQKRNEEFNNLREKSDNAILQTRMHLDRADRDYQSAMCREEEKREQLAESLRKELEAEKLEMEEKFRERLGQVQEEFNKELQTSTQEMQERHKSEMEKQWQRLVAEKEEAIHDLEARHRKKLQEAEDRLQDVETRHQHNLKDLKLMYDSEKASLDKRDISNANEIEQLHRKCRCLTNLFEEMRMRYERRDPRPEDLREIAELRSRCEAQERDISALTDRLRDMQFQLEELQGVGTANKKKHQIRKPPPKTIPTNCDVIYEEEERESPPPPPMNSPNCQEADEEYVEEENDDDDEKDEEDEISESTNYQKNTINDDDHPTKIISSNELNLLNNSLI